LKTQLHFLICLDWNLSFDFSGDQKMIFGSEGFFFSASNEEEAVSFIFGMTIGLAVLPEEVLDRIREIIR
jgi:hypothetical protein